MEKKQIVGFIVAAIVFVFVCSTNVIVKNYSNNQYNNVVSNLESIINNSNDLPLEPFIGVVKVEGTIMNTTSTGLFETESYNHKNTLEFIDDLKNSQQNRGILLYIDSPGGVIYDVDELYLKLKQYSEQTARPIWTYMASTACSGGYYIAMASDKIIANRNALTGSIGVIMSSSNYKEFLDKLGIKTINFTSGRNKAMGDPSGEITQEQINIYQSIIDEAYQQFLEIVSDGRGIDIETLTPIADGRVYTAKQALELNLIDSIQSYENTIDLICSELDENLIFYTPKNSLNKFSSIFSAVNNNSDLETISKILNISGKEVPMYYEIMYR